MFFYEKQAKIFKLRWWLLKRFLSNVVKCDYFFRKVPNFYLQVLAKFGGLLKSRFRDIKRFFSTPLPYRRTVGLKWQE